MRDKNGTPAQAEVEAEQWFAVMQSGAPTAREAADFTAWRRADPDHDRAYCALEDAWRRTGDHADHPEIKNMRQRAMAGPSTTAVGKRHILSLIGIAFLIGLVLSLLF